MFKKLTFVIICVLIVAIGAQVVLAEGHLRTYGAQAVEELEAHRKTARVDAGRMTVAKDVRALEGMTSKVKRQVTIPKDLRPGHEYFDDVMWGLERGVIALDRNGNVSPDATLSNLNLAVMGYLLWGDWFGEEEAERWNGQSMGYKKVVVPKELEWAKLPITQAYLNFGESMFRAKQRPGRMVDGVWQEYDKDFVAELTFLDKPANDLTLLFMVSRFDMDWSFGVPRDYFAHRKILLPKAPPVERKMKRWVLIFHEAVRKDIAAVRKWYEWYEWKADSLEIPHFGGMTEMGMALLWLERMGESLEFVPNEASEKLDATTIQSIAKTNGIAIALDEAEIVANLHLLRPLSKARALHYMRALENCVEMQGLNRQKLQKTHFEWLTREVAN